VSETLMCSGYPTVIPRVRGVNTLVTVSQKFTWPLTAYGRRGPSYRPIRTSERHVPVRLNAGREDRNAPDRAFASECPETASYTIITAPEEPPTALGGLRQ
jgi:hypothetical protein